MRCSARRRCLRAPRYFRRSWQAPWTLGPAASLMRSARLRLGRGVLCDYCFFGGSAKTALRSDFPLSYTASVTRCDGRLQRLQLDRSPQKSFRWARQLLESLGAPPMSSSFLESLDATPISAVHKRARSGHLIREIAVHSRDGKGIKRSAQILSCAVLVSERDR